VQFIIALLQQLLGQQAWGQLFANLDVLLAAVNKLLAENNAIDLDIGTVMTNQATELTAITTGVSDILAAIALAQQTGHEVTLPAVAPTGYGGASSSDVWDYTVAGDSRTTGYRQVSAGAAAINLGDGTYVRYPSWGSAEGWSISGDFDNGGEPEPSNSFLTPIALTDILLTDATYSAWVTRVLGAAPTGIIYGRAYVAQAGSGWLWVCVYSEGDFLLYQAYLRSLAPLGGGGAPVWPGLARVTLGASVALSEALTVAELMDGVIIELTSVPSQRGFYGYDDVKVYQNIGALVFVDDNSDVEGFQAIGATFGVYSPRSMVRASAVKIRGGPGVTGTVTPWLITS